MSNLLQISCKTSDSGARVVPCLGMVENIRSMVLTFRWVNAAHSCDNKLLRADALTGGHMECCRLSPDHHAVQNPEESFVRKKEKSGATGKLGYLYLFWTAACR